IVGSADGTGAAASFNGPQGIAVDGTGNIYVADTFNSTIRKITPSGVVTTLAGIAHAYGSADGTGASASFGYVTSIAIDSAGLLYAADIFNGTIRKITSSGIVTTLAGSPGGYGSTNGTGAAASFAMPIGVAVDSSGNVYVAEFFGYDVRKITPAGVVTRLAGQPNASDSMDGTSGHFVSPTAIAVDGLGNVYVADGGKSFVTLEPPSGTTIRKITPAGFVTTLAGTASQVGLIDGTGNAARFNNSRGIAVDLAGNLVVADTGSHMIRRVTSAGVVTSFAGGAGVSGLVDANGSVARFNSPGGLAMDGAGNMLVADIGNHALRRVTPTGGVTTVKADIDVGFMDTSGIAVDGNGNIYGVYQGCQITKISSAGTLSFLAGVGYSGSADGPAQSASFSNPQGLVADSLGNVYVADSQNNTIRKVTPQGVVTTFAGLAGNVGSDDGLGDTARFNDPAGIAMDSAGFLYVTDLQNSSVRKISPAGNVTTLAGLAGSSGSVDGTGSAARFLSPQGIAVDALGNVFVADTGNHLVRMITPAGVVSTLGGRAESTDFAVGTGSTVHFPNPVGVAVDSTGQVYVSDGTYNSIIVGGIATTPAITAQPVDQSVVEAQAVTFSVTVTGGLLSYQWRKNAVNIPNANSPALTFADTVPGDAGNYDVVVTNVKGSVTSATVSLSVSAIPTISAISPARQVLQPGQSLSLSVTATGTGSLGYQWIHNGVAISGATVQTYSAASVTSQNSGWYEVRITDSFGTRRSSALFVAVAPAVTQVRAWGTAQPESDVPPNLSDAIAISSSGSHVLALRSNGTVDAWGYDASGQTNVPAGLSSVVAVAAGGSCSLALKSDGTVVAWGSEAQNQTSVPTGLSKVVAISCGFEHCLALKSDGTVVAWGAADYGQTVVPSGLSGVTAISAGMYSSLALKSDGSVVAWGDNTYGQCNVPVGLSTVTAISGYGYHALALKSDATVVAWGANDSGETTIPVGLSGVAGISTESSVSFAVKSTGIVVAWGANNGGQTTVPSDLANVLSVSLALAIRDGSGDAVPTITTQPSSQTKLEGQSVLFTAVAGGIGPISYQWRKSGANIAGANTATLALTNLVPADAGNYDIVVSNYLGSTTSSTAILAVNPLPVLTNLSQARQQLTTGQTLNLSVTATGTGSLNYQWARNGVAIAGANGANYSLSNASVGASGWYVVSVTDNIGTRNSSAMFVFVSPAITQLSASGINTNGQLDIPALLSNVVSVSAGWQHVLVLKRDGTIVGWGLNDYGQTTIPSGLTNVVQPLAAGRASFALKSDGTVVGWGSHDSTGMVDVPMGLTNVVALSASDTHVLALKNDGTVVAWGDVDYGFGESTVPAGLNNVIQVAAGFRHSLALKSDGTVVVWGLGFMPPAGLSGVVAISAGGNFDLALKSDGTVVAWGSDASDLGLSDVPAGLSSVAAISAGSSHSLALKSDGTVLGWGTNSYGESSVPSGWSGIVGVAGGWFTSYAIRDASNDSAPSIDSQPLSVTAVELQPATFTVGASGSGPLFYQWRNNGTNIPGATSVTFTIAKIAPADVGNYDVIVSNHIGSVTSAVATLTVNPVPAITSLSATRQMKTPGQSLNLSVTATGTGTLGYQWIHNGLPVSGAAAADFSASNITIQDGGWYAVLISDSIGTRRSAPIFVTVTPVSTQVVTWGSASQSAVPAGLTNAIAVSAGNSYLLALKQDGTVIGWNSSGSGEVSIPSGLSDVVAISAGYAASLAIKSDGTVVTWGDNSIGQAVPADLSDVVGIAAGYGYSLALRSDGTVRSWGTSDYYGIGAIPAGLSNVVSISMHYTTAVALKADGTVVTWGSGTSGYPVPAGLSNVTAVSAGYGSNFLALKSDKTVVAWGYNGYDSSSGPSGLTNVLAIAAGTGQSLALKSDGTVVGWGNASDQVIPSFLTNTLAISSGQGYSMALRDSSNDSAPTFSVQPLSLTIPETQSATFTVMTGGGQPQTFQWRKNGVNLTGATGPTLTIAPAGLADAGTFDVVATNLIGSTTSFAATLTINPIPVVTSLSSTRQVLFPGQSTALMVVASGTGPLSYQWVHNGKSISGATTPSIPLGPVTLADSGWYVILITDDFGTRRSSPIFITVEPSATKVTVWGGTSAVKAIPNSLTDAVSASAGYGHVLALKRDGTVVAWGDNSYGQLNVPAGLTGVVAVAAGGSHSLALKSDGTVIGWGSYINYQQASPPDNLNGVVAIADIGNRSMALKSDGTVVVWGVNNGPDTTTLPEGLAGIGAIAGDSSYSFGLKNDGTAVSWVAGALAQYGPFAGLSGLAAISASGTHALALTKTGAVFESGQFYSGNATAPAGLVGVVSIAAGDDHSLALKNDGTVIGWGGYNSYGQATVPSDLTKVVSICAGTNFSVAVSDATVVASSVASSQVLGDFDGNGMADLVWTNTQTGERSMWFLNGNMTSGGASLGVVPVEWVVSATADFDGDGKADIFWTNTITGDRAVWLMNGSTMRTNTF
ncbi:MAG: immunoglobulin domain-containing protein, partial [Lacunisphaera sp.]